MKSRWLIAALILLMASCARTGGSGIPPGETEVVPSSAVPTVSEITEQVLPSATEVPPSPTLENTSTPAPPESIPAPSAIIAKVEGGPNSFLLVGGSQNGNWVNAMEVAEDLAVNTSYQINSAFDFQDWAAGQDLFYEGICDQYYVTVDPLPAGNAVGVSGEWAVQPRTPVEIPIDTEIYLQAITAWQIEQAPSMPIPLIDKIWKIDVEGNGTDEVFINGTRYAEPTGHNVEPRDYSVVLMRTVSGSDLVTIELIGDYYKEEAVNQFPLTYNLEFIGDLNGDGRMEVVVGISRWEGSGVMVFEIDGAEVELVLSVMCSL